MMRFLNILLVFSLSQSVLAEDSIKQILFKFFDGLKSLSADFEQEVQNAQLSLAIGGSVEIANGKLWILRPGKFRWNYIAPYEQEVVSNAKKVWIFDKDLEQVTVKSADVTLGSTPAMLLSNDKPLDEAFSLKFLGKRFQLNYVELTPKDQEASFTSILLGFDHENLREMQLQDNLGQTTRLAFKNIKRNPDISADLFEFKAPENADIFDTSNIQ